MEKPPVKDIEVVKKEIETLPPIHYVNNFNPNANDNIVRSRRNNEVLDKETNTEDVDNTVRKEMIKSQKNRIRHCCDGSYILLFILVAILSIFLFTIYHIISNVFSLTLWII